MGGCWLALLPLAGYGQRRFSAAQLDTLAVDHLYHCDERTGKYRGYFAVGEEKMTLLFLTVAAGRDSLLLTGQVLEPLPVEMFMATTSATTCQIENKVGETDERGAFSFRIIAAPAESVYFTAPGYRDLEIRVRQIWGR